MTQSEYVREELLMLQVNLKTLEDRANNIEADIRNAMSIGTCINSCAYGLDIIEFMVECLQTLEVKYNNTSQL